MGIVTVRFSRQTDLPVSVERAFDVSRDIDLHVASMQKSKERAIAGTTSGLIGPGETVTWQAWHLGVRFRMTSQIVEYDRPRVFVDTQIRGPFARLRHEHQFSPTTDGCTMTDRVEFTAPFGPIGRLVERVILGNYMKHLIDTRNKTLAAALS